MMPKLHRLCQIANIIQILPKICNISHEMEIFNTKRLSLEYNKFMYKPASVLTLILDLIKAQSEIESSNTMVTVKDETSTVK